MCRVEFPDLTPEEKKECQARLDKTVKTLLKIKKDLKQATDKEDIDVRTVCVQGLHPSLKVEASDFTHSFSEAPGMFGRKKHDQAFVLNGLVLTMESNYMVDAAGNVVGPVDEFFLTFEREKDARYALEVKTFTLNSAGYGRSVNFTKPAQTSAMRATFRKIGPLIKRVRAIGEELKAMGAVWDGEMYRPDANKYMDKSWFESSLAGMKRAREGGQSLDHNTFSAIKRRKPLDTAKFLAQTKKLYDEECDCLIALREFQLNGVKFDF